jgi:hypothetical protein
MLLIEQLEERFDITLTSDYVIDVHLLGVGVLIQRGNDAAVTVKIFFGKN